MNFKNYLNEAIQGKTERDLEDYTWYELGNTMEKEFKQWLKKKSTTFYKGGWTQNQKGRYSVRSGRDSFKLYIDSEKKGSKRYLTVRLIGPRIDVEVFKKADKQDDSVIEGLRNFVESTFGIRNTSVQGY